MVAEYDGACVLLEGIAHLAPSLEEFKARDLLGLLRVDLLKIIDTTTDETVRSAQHRMLAVQGLADV